MTFAACLTKWRCSFRADHCSILTMFRVPLASCKPHNICMSSLVTPSYRQYAEIENDERTSLCYHDQRGKQGWLTLKGNAARKGAVKTDGTVDVQFVVTALEIMTYNEDLTFENARPIILVRAEADPSNELGWKVKS